MKQKQQSKYKYSQKYARCLFTDYVAFQKHENIRKTQK